MQVPWTFLRTCQAAAAARRRRRPQKPLLSRRQSVPRVCCCHDLAVERLAPLLAPSIGAGLLLRSPAFEQVQRQNTVPDPQASSSLDSGSRARQTTCSSGVTMRAESYRADLLLPLMLCHRRMACCGMLKVLYHQTRHGFAP